MQVTADLPGVSRGQVRGGDTADHNLRLPTINAKRWHCLKRIQSIAERTALENIERCKFLPDISLEQIGGPTQATYSARTATNLAVADSPDPVGTNYHASLLQNLAGKSVPQE